MIKSLIIFLEETILSFGAVGVFVASFLEEVIPPIPSTIVLLLSGAAFLHGKEFSIEYVATLLFMLAIPATFGMLLGSLVLYSVGYAGGKPIVMKYGRYAGISWTLISKVEERFKSTTLDELLIVFFRAVPVVPNTAISIFCGIIRMNFSKYLLISAVGYFCRAILLSLIGAEVGNFYRFYNYSFEEWRGYVGILVVVVALIFVYVFFKRKRNPLS